MQITKIEGIGPAYAEKLRAVGISKVNDLLKHAASRHHRQRISKETGISAGMILEWVNRADLMRVPGIGSEYSDLLEAAGVDTVRELANRRPDNLFQKMAIANKAVRRVRRLPSEGEVATWIERARQLPAVISY